MTKWTTEISVVEDEIDNAEGYVRHTGLGDIMDEVGYFTRMEDLVDAILDKGVVRVFWIDLNLDDGQEEEGGLRIIKRIKPLYPDSLIIVYTAYYEMEEECRKAGAHHFFKKGEQYNETMEKIRGVVTDFLSQKGLKIKVQQFNGVIAHIDEQRIRVECSNGERMVEKTFPADLFYAAYTGSGLRLDEKVSIKAIQKNSTISLTIDEVGGDAGSQDQELPPNSLLKSSIWFNKLK